MRQPAARAAAHARSQQRIHVAGDLAVGLRGIGKLKRLLEA
jgi:hypothetical protein